MVPFRSRWHRKLNDINDATQLAGVIAHISLMLELYLEDVIPKSLFVCVCSQLYDDAALGS